MNLTDYLDRLFKLKAHDTTIRTEIMAGFTTYLTMSYILFINPIMLSQTGMDKGAVFAATCIAGAIGSVLMGIVANYPIALAPGMALNSYFTYSIVLGQGHSWQVALGAIFISGLIFFCISISPLREHIINFIPKSLKIAIVAGIGLFLGMIGFKNAGLIQASSVTFVTLGNLKETSTLLAILGFFIMIGLDALGIVMSIMISILTITMLSVLLGLNTISGIFSLPPSIMPTLFQLDITSAFSLGLSTIIFAILFVDFFDNSGTLIGIAYRAKLINKDSKLPRIGRALTMDSIAAMVSALLGTSTTTNYLESMVGVKSGGKTGLMACTVALLFLLSLFIAPLATSVPIYATAPALIYVACLMVQSFNDFDWSDSTEYTPAVITAITMPLTFSIADGIAFGFISYTCIKLLSGRYTALNPVVIILSAAFLVRYMCL